MTNTEKNISETELHERIPNLPAVIAFNQAKQDALKVLRNLPASQAEVDAASANLNAAIAELKKIIPYPVTFQVTDAISGNAIQGAQVSVTESVYQTDINGHLRYRLNREATRIP